MQPKPKSVQEAVLRRARDLAGGVSYLAKHLHVSAADLDAMLHGVETIPSWVVLRAMDFINEAESRGITPPGFPPDWQERPPDTKH